MANDCCIMTGPNITSRLGLHLLDAPAPCKKILLLAALFVGAAGAAQAHLDAGRAYPAGVKVAQVRRDEVGERADKDGRVVERLRTLEVDAELCAWAGRRVAGKRGKVRRADSSPGRTSCASSCTSTSSSYSVSMWSLVNATGTSRTFFLPSLASPLIESDVCGPCHAEGPTWDCHVRRYGFGKPSEVITACTVAATSEM